VTALGEGLRARDEFPAVNDPIALISRTPAFERLAGALASGKRAVATGSVGSSTTLVAGALAGRLACPVVLIVAHLDDADEAADELNAWFGSGGAPPFAMRLPALEASPGESGVHVESFAERLAVVRALAEQTPPRVLICPIAALMQAVPSPSELPTLMRSIRAGQTLDPDDLGRWLDQAGYRRVDAIEEPGDFARRGGIMDVFAPAAGDLAGPVRLDFFGDELERLAEIDLETMGSDRRLDRVDFVAVRDDLVGSDRGTLNLLELLPKNAVALLAETMEIVEQARGYYERLSDSGGVYGPPRVLKMLEERTHALAELNQFSAGSALADVRVALPVEPLPAFDRDAAAAVGELGELAAGARVVCACQNQGERARLAELEAEHAPGTDLDSQVSYLHRGFVWNAGEARDDRLALVPYAELLGRFETRRRSGRLRAGRAMDTFLDVKPGDFVVHAEHGIARFLGLTLLKPGTKRTPKPPSKRSREPDVAEAEEYLTLEFARNAKLHVPCRQIDLVQRYVGGFSGKPPLSTIGGAKWKTQKAKVAESVRDLAAEMLRVRAAREATPGVQYPGDTPWQREFEAEFPYQETEDQLAALAEIKRDMQSPRPMDRLLCGDVGFGKTELAIRAAFKCVEFGKQVAVLVPTTVLAEQHEVTFRQRFADYPFRVESLSRFKTTKELNATLRDLRQGKVDIVVGTHRLLSKDVKFADLGLVVVDEEQRFGVEHKERLLQLRVTVDVLTLSATPIPRTLHMAMLGIRDISSLTTPPVDRRAIVTEVLPYNEQRVKRAIERELAREGQVFYVHNRVHNIRTVADDVARMVPDAKVVFGHGQMQPKELEEVMLTFMRRQADVLVSTTIIESGIDIPTANTMIVADADRFGLAELHQLRGRVGRYKHRAYCYLMLPESRPIKEVAQKRLKAIEQYTMLGAGFKIAMRDLEIRGAGNLLGAEQSGHIAAVGYDMYCRLLDQAVHDLATPEAQDAIEHVSVDLGVTGVFPRAYIPAEARRLEAYRRLAQSRTPAELDSAEADLVSAYGDLPPAARRLADLARVAAAARAVGVRTVARRAHDVVFLTERPDPVAGMLTQGPGQVRIIGADLAQTNARTPTGTPLAEVYWRPPESYLDPVSLLRILPRRLGFVAWGPGLSEPSPAPAGSSDTLAQSAHRGTRQGSAT